MGSVLPARHRLTSSLRIVIKSDMGIDYYNMEASSPCRGPRLTAAALGVDLNLKTVDLMKKEQMTPEYLKMNPQHTVPTMDDGGFYLWESRAISSYLVEAYGKDDSLYPKDPKQRAVVDQRMYFDMGSLYAKFGECIYPCIFGGVTEISADKKAALADVLTLLDGFISSSGGYVAGKHLTIADHCCAATISTMAEAGVDICKYSNVAAWYKKVQTEMPRYAEVNAPGAQEFGGKWIKPKMAELGISW